MGIRVTWQPVANFDALVNAVRAGSAPMWMFGWLAEGETRSKSGALALTIVKGLVRDAEVNEAVAKGDAPKAEELTLRKALLIPLIHYKCC